MNARTLILGGGFGGIATAVELRRLLGADHEIVLVDRKPQFAMGLRKLWELVGHGSIAEGSRSRMHLARHGVEFVHAEIDSIEATRARRGRPAGRSRATISSWRSARSRGPTLSPDWPSTATTSGRSKASPAPSRLCGASRAAAAPGHATTGWPTRPCAAPG